jgi:hypothetical protein
MKISLPDNVEKGKNFKKLEESLKYSCGNWEILRPG